MTSRVRPGGRTSAVAGAAALAAVALVVGVGCRDEILAPTQGFIRVDVGGVAGVGFFVDGDSARTYLPGILGPYPEGTYVVTVARECFAADPAGGVEVQVVAGRTAGVRFTLEPREFGSVEISATDELTGAAVVGARVLLDSSGTFVDRGHRTPAVIDSLPCGPTRFLIRNAGHEDLATDVDVDTGVRTDVRVELGPLRGVLAEMMTYVVCPNCPPSVDSLEAVHADHPEDFYVVEWHTFPGLPLYDPRWEAREDYYLGGAGLGAPVVLIQGDVAGLLHGSEASTLAEYRPGVEAALAECASDCPVALSTEGAVDAGGAVLTARLKWRGGALPDRLVLRFVLLEDGVDAPGNDSPYSDVPREYHEEPFTFGAPGEIREVRVTLPVQGAWNPDSLGYVVYLQSDATRRILAVHGSP